MFKGNSLKALILELVLYRNALWEWSGANLGPLSPATLQQSCLVPRRLSLSLDKNLHAKEDGKEKKGEMALRSRVFFVLPMVHGASLPVTRVSRSPLCEIRSA